MSFQDEGDETSPSPSLPLPYLDCPLQMPHRLVSQSPALAQLWIRTLSGPPVFPLGPDGQELLRRHGDESTILHINLTNKDEKNMRLCQRKDGNKATLLALSKGPG